MQKFSSDIDRKTASRLLRVSVRTIDRYIRRGQLVARENQGRIWLRKKDIMDFSRGAVTAPITSIDRPRPVYTRTQTVDLGDVHFYRDLYEETRRALHDNQQKLEQANYRMGQMESQMVSQSALPELRWSVPHQVNQLAQAAGPKVFTRREEASPDSSSNEFLKRELIDKDHEITVLKDLVKKEKAGRIIFSVIVYALLILQPIFWYILRAPGRG